MENKTRRAFLRWMAIQMGAVFGGSFLASCRRQESRSLQTTALPIAQSLQPTEDEPAGAPTLAEEATAEPTETSASHPHLAVAAAVSRVRSYARRLPPWAACSFSSTLATK